MAVLQSFVTPLWRFLRLPPLVQSCSRSRMGIVLVVHRIFLFFRRCYASVTSPPLSINFPPYPPDLHTASHTRDKFRRLSMRPTDLNTFFQCL